jgi:hypothetical protein
MTTQKDKDYQLKLTDQQKAEIRELTGKDADILQLSVEELEERIAPSMLAKGVAGA